MAQGMAPTRHFYGMKALLCLVLLAGCVAAAPNDPDQTAVEHTILLLNRNPLQRALFTADADGVEQLEAALASARPAVIPHSNEPMSEHWPFFTREPFAIMATRVRFLSRSVALVDARVKGQPVLLVMKRESGWKVASVRFLK